MLTCPQLHASMTQQEMSFHDVRSSSRSEEDEQKEEEAQEEILLQKLQVLLVWTSPTLTIAFNSGWGG